LLGVVAYLCARFRLGLAGFFIIGFLLVVPIISFTWAGIHGLVYSSSEIKLFATFLFGFFGAALTLLFASFIPWLVWHFFNNFFIKLKDAAIYTNGHLMPQEDKLFISLVIWAILLFIYLIIEFLIWRYKRKKYEKVVIPQ